MNIIGDIPPDLINFAIVVVFSFLVGLEQRKLHPQQEEHVVFGTDRTFTFIGLLGYILYLVDSRTLVPFLGGGLALTVLLGVFYQAKVRHGDSYGLTSIIVALITYSFTPLVYSQPYWLSVLVLIIVLVVSELKETFIAISRRFESTEFVTLGKFLAITGVVLPLLPDTPVLPESELTAQQIWLSVVIISSISYVSYLLRKFVFPESGIVLSGILGGLYSSTGVTVILSRQGRSDPTNRSRYASGMIWATAAMHLRVVIIVFIFNAALGWFMLPYLAVLVIACILLAYWLMRRSGKEVPADPKSTRANPLELPVALLFAVLFVVFSLLTQYTLEHFGQYGLNILSFVLGMTDIDPFLLNLFQGRYAISQEAIAVATLCAITSNNILKSTYTFLFGSRSLGLEALRGYGPVIVLNVIFALYLWSQNT